MKRWKIALLGILLFLGASACNSKELPAATTAGFVVLDVPLTPSKTPPIVSSKISLPTAETQIPTKSPHPPASRTTTSSTPQSCQGTAGHIEEGQLESDLFDDPLDYLIYLPPCYTEQLDRHYPILYLFHGQTYTNQHWIDLGVVNIVDRLISNGEVAPFIMVFPYDRDHYKPPTENPFGQAVLVDLIPAIDREFRTIPKRAFRAIGGISRGGNWAAHLGLQHPAVFSAIGLHSTPIFSTDTNQEITEWLEDISVEELPRMFLDIGRNDRWLEFTLVFEELLNNASIPHEWHLYPGFHEDDYWEAHLEQYVRWYVRDW